jgi:23S rRNA (guanosine2251-2'-O)-methyltransferase
MEYLLGRNSVHEALRAKRRRVEHLLVAEGAEAKGTLGDIVALCQQAKVVVRTVKRRELDQIGEELKHQGVAAKVSDYPLAEVADMLALASSRAEQPLLLALDALEDPQNVGSLLRTAEAVGVHGVLIPERRAVGVTPAVSRASAGAVEHLLVAQVVNLGRALSELKTLGLWVVGVEETPQSQSYLHVDLNMPLALVLGSEGRGMRPSIAKACDLLVQLPMRGQIHSLNVSVAGSILLYRVWEARQAKV